MHELVERALALSHADQCVVLAWETTTANVRWANNTSTTNGVGRSTRLAVVSVVGRRVGSVSVTSVSAGDLEAVVRRSEEAARTTPEAEDAQPLPEGAGAPPDWDAPVEPAGIERFAELAPALGGAFVQAGEDGIRLFGYAELSSSTCWLATSTGVRRRHTRLDGLLELNAKTPDFARSAWVGQATRTFDGVDVPALYARLAQRLAWSAVTLELPAGHYQALLEPSAAADMLFAAYAAASARDAADGRTVYSRPGGATRVGEPLYPKGVDIWSDPFEPGLEATPFVVATSSSSHGSVFDNGLALARTSWVRDGVLEALVSTRHSAAATGTDPTPWVDNLVLDAGAGPSLDEMIASTTGRALLVTCFWYMREVDPHTLLLTGLTRDGVFLVEDGEVKGAVNNFRFNMSPVDMLAQTVEFGASVPALPREFGDWFRSVRTPPLRVERFNMSSVSRAT
ncbi:MAG: metallopeptidase TldD-related protein [Actinomycetota bacterium]